MSSLINTKPELYLGWAYDRVEETDKANPYIDKIGGKHINKIHFYFIFFFFFFYIVKQ